MWYNNQGLFVESEIVTAKRFAKLLIMTGKSGKQDCEWSVKNGTYFLYLIWKNPVNRRNYEVGKLTRKEEYKFEYSNEYKQALEDGWKLIQAFPEVKEYYSKELFPVFSSRLPDRKRRDIQTVLKKYGLEEYDGYELLRKSGDRLPIDTYEFFREG